MSAFHSYHVCYKTVSRVLSYSIGQIFEVFLVRYGNIVFCLDIILVVVINFRFFPFMGTRASICIKIVHCLISSHAYGWYALDSNTHHQVVTETIRRRSAFVLRQQIPFDLLWPWMCEHNSHVSKMLIRMSTYLIGLVDENNHSK